jgi:hypothetical protein
MEHRQDTFLLKRKMNKMATDNGAVITNATVTALKYFDTSKNGNSRYMFAYESGDDRAICYTPIDSSYTNVVRNAYREGLPVNLVVRYMRKKWVATRIELT